MQVQVGDDVLVQGDAHVGLRPGTVIHVHEDGRADVSVRARLGENFGFRQRGDPASVRYVERAPRAREPHAMAPGEYCLRAELAGEGDGAA